MKLKHLFNSKKFTQIIAGVFIFSTLGYGVYARVAQGRVKAPLVPVLTTNGWQTGGQVQTRVTLSQNKVLQGSDGLIYMQVDMEALNDGTVLVKKRVPTDFVIVLDRSGSMSGKDKMTFAHKAIESLLSQIGEDDRFALVTFDDQVDVPIALTSIHKSNRDKIIAKIQQVSPRGSTNLGEGLIRGMSVLKSAAKQSGHAQRLIMISDGMANMGITSVAELSRIAGGAVKGEFVISTIGVGLDFNESLLSSVADYGTGSYYFLENVAKLDKILADEFYGASQILARNVLVRLNLASGILVEDASGYPVKREGGKVIVSAGHLYQNQKKTFFVTLKAPTQNIYAEALGSVEVSYDIEGKDYNLALVQPDLTIACLPQEKKEEVKKSVDQKTFTNAWTQNNYGRFLKSGGGSIGEGDLNTAKSTLASYKDKLVQAYDMAPSPEMQQQISELNELEEDMDDSFTGSDADEKQKRLSKKLHYEGGLIQRVEKKK